MLPFLRFYKKYFLVIFYADAYSVFISVSASSSSINSAGTLAIPATLMSSFWLTFISFTPLVFRPCHISTEKLRISPVFRPMIDTPSTGIRITMPSLVISMT